MNSKNYLSPYSSGFKKVFIFIVLMNNFHNQCVEQSKYYWKKLVHYPVVHLCSSWCPIIKKEISAGNYYKIISVLKKYFLEHETTLQSNRNKRFWMLSPYFDSRTMESSMSVHFLLANMYCMDLVEITLLTNTRKLAIWFPWQPALSRCLCICVHSRSMTACRTPEVSCSQCRLK